MKRDDIIVGQKYWVQYGEHRVHKARVIAKPDDCSLPGHDGVLVIVCKFDGEYSAVPVLTHKVVGPVATWPWATTVRVAYDVLCWLAFVTAIGLALWREWR